LDWYCSDRSSYRHLSCRDNIALPLALAGVPLTKGAHAAEELLEAANLGYLATDRSGKSREANASVSPCYVPIVHNPQVVAPTNR